MGLVNISLTGNLKEKFLETGTCLHYKKGHLINRPEDDAQGVYYIDKGQVMIYFADENGDESIVGFFQEGSVFFKAGSLLKMEPLTMYFDALTEVTIYRIPLDYFMEKVLDNKDRTLDYIKQISLNNLFLSERLRYQCYKDSFMRFFHWLIFMNKYYGKENGNTSKIEVILNYEIIANMVLVTREYLGKIIKKSIDQKIISMDRGQITILNLKKLKNNCLDK